MKILKEERRLFGPGLVYIPGLLFLLLLIAGCSSGRDCFLVGRSAPYFCLKGLKGENVSLNDFRDNLLIIEFWAPWCSYCRKNIQPLKQIKAVYPQVAILGPSLELGKKQITKFAEQQALPYRVALADRSILELYGVSGIPVTVLVDPKGIVRYWHAGPLTVRDMKEKIEECLSQTG